MCTASGNIRNVTRSLKNLSRGSTTHWNSRPMKRRRARYSSRRSIMRLYRNLSSKNRRMSSSSGRENDREPRGSGHCISSGSRGVRRESGSSVIKNASSLRRNLNGESFINKRGRCLNMSASWKRMTSPDIPKRTRVCRVSRLFRRRF